MVCPICKEKKSSEFLKLKHYPIYQHPVSQDCKVDDPFTTDVEYVVCDTCSHCYQPNYDEDVLRSIYKHYYYTPSPENIETTFNQDFFEFFQSSVINNSGDGKLKVLEIGSSSGEMLRSLQSINDYIQVKGVEPNVETSKIARAKGIEVDVSFFDRQYAQSNKEPFDIVFSRHVIEHIFDFEDFFEAVNKVTHSDSRLVLETPSLDASLSTMSIAPYHVEHVHVFSSYSIAFLAERFGWNLQALHITDSNNLIVEFSQQGKKLTPSRINSSQLQPTIARYQNLKRELDLLSKDKYLVFWGAGSGTRTLISLSGIVPDEIVDGNPNKEGKKYAGLDKTIQYAETRIRHMLEQGSTDDIALVIGSSFHREIKKSLADLNWQGKVYAPYE